MPPYEQNRFPCTEHKMKIYNKMEVNEYAKRKTNNAGKKKTTIHY